MPEARPRSNPDEDTKLNFEFFPICFMDKDYSSSPFLIHAQSKLCNNLQDFLFFCRVGILIFFLFPRSYFFFVLEVLLLLPQLQLRFMFSTFFLVKCINYTSVSFLFMLIIGIFFFLFKPSAEFPFLSFLKFRSDHFVRFVFHFCRTYYRISFYSLNNRSFLPP